MMFIFLKHGFIFIKPLLVWQTILLAALFTNSCAKKAQPQQEVPERDYKNRSIKEVLSVVAYRQLRELGDGEYKRGDWAAVEASQSPKGVDWQYPWGVTLYGLQYANEKVLQDPKILSFVRQHNEIAARQFDYLNWQVKTFGKYVNPAGLEELLKLYMLDHCGAMATQVLEGILRHPIQPTPEIEALLHRVAEFISHQQSRLPNGVFWRPESHAGASLWIDDLYMSCPFLVRWYLYTGEQKYLDDAVAQILGFASYTQDADGLWHHGYFFDQNQRSPYKWGRANGWAVVATVEVLSAMPTNHPDHEKVLAIFRKHIEGLVSYQAASGLWHQVLDHRELWEETSCSAMFAYGIARAVSRGWIEKDYLKIAQKAFAGLNSRITRDGAILGVCQGTSIGENLDYYLTRQRPFDDNHGQGAVLLALTELIVAQNQ
jgi:rhamnogalacturonyl hydrolase YesR